MDAKELNDMACWNERIQKESAHQFAYLWSGEAVRQSLVDRNLAGKEVKNKRAFSPPRMGQSRHRFIVTPMPPTVVPNKKRPITARAAEDHAKHNQPKKSEPGPTSPM